MKKILLLAALLFVLSQAFQAPLAKAAAAPDPRGITYQTNGTATATQMLIFPYGLSVQVAPTGSNYVVRAQDLWASTNLLNTALQAQFTSATGRLTVLEGKTNQWNTALTNATASSDFTVSVSGNVLSISINASSPLANLRLNNGGSLTNIPSSAIVFSASSVPISALSTNGAAQDNAITWSTNGGAAWRAPAGGGGGVDLTTDQTIAGNKTFTGNTSLNGAANSASNLTINGTLTAADLGTMARQNSNSVVIVGGSIVLPFSLDTASGVWNINNGGSTTVADFNNQRLLDSSGGRSLNFTARELVDAIHTVSINYDSRGLLQAGNGTPVLNWQSTKLVDNGGTMTGDWNRRYLTGGAWSMQTNELTSLGAPTGPLSAVRLTDLQSATGGFLTAVTGLTVAQGGTGGSTFSTNGILIASADSPFRTLSLGTSTQLLHGNASGDPTWGAVDLATAQVTGLLPVGNGGSGVATFPTNALLLGRADSPVASLGLGTTTQVLHGNASGDPTWGAIDLATAQVTGILPTNNVPDSGVVAGTYGETNLIPKITFDSKGRALSVTNVAVAAGGGGNASTVCDIFISAADFGGQMPSYGITTNNDCTPVNWSWTDSGGDSWAKGFTSSSTAILQTKYMWAMVKPAFTNSTLRVGGVTKVYYIYSNVSSATNSIALRFGWGGQNFTTNLPAGTANSISTCTISNLFLPTWYYPTGVSNNYVNASYSQFAGATGAIQRIDMQMQ